MASNYTERFLTTPGSSSPIQVRICLAVIGNSQDSINYVTLVYGDLLLNILMSLTAPLRGPRICIGVFIVMILMKAPTVALARMPVSAARPTSYEGPDQNKCRKLTYCRRIVVPMANGCSYWLHQMEKRSMCIR